MLFADSGRQWAIISASLDRHDGRAYDGRSTALFKWPEAGARRERSQWEVFRGGACGLWGHVMPLFACNGYPDVEAGTPRAAARCFANLRAKSEYGSGGECTSLEPSLGRESTFQASSETIAAMAPRLPTRSR